MRGRFGRRQKPVRSIDRGARRFDLLAQLRNLAAGPFDQRPRLGHELAMLGVHKTHVPCSSGATAPIPMIGIASQAGLDGFCLMDANERTSAWCLVPCP